MLKSIKPPPPLAALAVSFGRYSEKKRKRRGEKIEKKK